MIIFQFLGEWGRLGNQLFQYATLFAIGKKNGYEIGIPLHHKKQNPYLNIFIDDCFENLSAKSCLPMYEGDKIKHKYMEPYPNIKFNPEVLNLPDNTNIHGYFQSEKYFKDYKEDLLKEYKFKEYIEKTANGFRNSIPCECISLHIRIGDYLKIQNKHPICNIDYYAEALSLLPQDLPIILFSDSLEHALPIIKIFNRPTFIFDTKNDFIELCLMSKCNYHIIANSSFSWWGSWLSNSKKTIAPKQWFGSSNEVPKEWDDIYCEGWTVI